MTQASPIKVSVWTTHPSSMTSTRMEPRDAGSLVAMERAVPARQRLDSDNICVLDHATPEAGIYAWT